MTSAADSQVMALMRTVETLEESETAQQAELVKDEKRVALEEKLVGVVVNLLAAEVMPWK